MSERQIPEWIRRILGDAASEPDTLAHNAERVREGFGKKLKRVVRRIPFAEDLLAAYFCTLDPATPTRVKATLLAALAYFVLPFDTIPDFLLGLGFGDDATVLLAAISMVASHISDTHREAAQRALNDDLDIIDLEAQDITPDDPTHS